MGLKIVQVDALTGRPFACCLAPYWSERLGRTSMVGHQISTRKGVVRVRGEGDWVLLGGQAVTLLRGELVPRSRVDP